MRYEDKAWQDSMKIRMDCNNLMNKHFGLKDLDDMKTELDQARQALKDKPKRGLMDWKFLPYNQDEVVDEILSYVNETVDTVESFVLLGIGGSALGPMALQQALNHPYYNELPRAQRKYPRFYVADNVDPERLTYLFDVIDLKTSVFNVVSKSGSTSETMSQFMIIKEMLEKELGKAEAKKHIICTTDQEKGNLIKIAKDEGYKTFIIPSGVGGRFSELCPVGLIPAAFCGIDIKELLAGAAYMDKLCDSDDLFKNPALMYAAISYALLKKGRNISVMIPYADSLKYISDWYAQLWAESLGKKYDNEGKVVNVGQTPVKALGVTDQHSQVQLYTEGPDDKLIVFLGVDRYKETITIPKIYEDMPSLGFLGGVTQNKLIQVEQEATEYALWVAEKLSMTITLPEVNAFTIGQIIVLFEIATAYAGELLNINAFDQPGVEEGKNATYAMFGRPGYEEKKKELESKPEKDKRLIV